MNFETSFDCVRRRLCTGLLLLLTTWPAAAGAASAAPSPAIRLLPENPRYFEWRGKPVILVTSGEHYGAVVNPDFDYVRYLDTIASFGFNHTRLFLGDYVEETADFGIVDNPLVVAPGRFLAPWARSSTPGFPRGGNKFDLDRWDSAYFERLHRYLDACDERGITVEAVFFFAGAVLKNHPLAATNNVNATTPISARQYLTLENGNVLARQEAYCRKLVREMNRHGNVILNICNEPWFDHQAHPGFASQPADEVKQWIGRVSEWIADEESRLPVRHLMSVDLTNQGSEIAPHELQTSLRNVSVFNVHYDANADILKRNRGLERALTLNETGFNGTGDAPYRLQGWRFLLEGGAMYGNLDFGFTVGHEDGSFTPKFVNGTYDCGGSRALRAQLAVLKSFVNSLPIARLRPDNSMVIGGPDEWSGLSAPGEAYAVWFPGEGELDVKLNLPHGTWQYDWVDPMTGAVTSETATHDTWAVQKHGVRHGGGVALRITRPPASGAPGALGDQSGSSRAGTPKR